MKHSTAFGLALAVAASAHIKAGSLSVKSGTTWTAGQKVSLSWSASIDHDKSNYNLWYSPDSGKTWTSVKTGIPGAASNVLVNYEWTVPDQPTTKGILRVFQTFGGTVSSNLSNPGDYTLFSPAFKIVAASGVASSRAGAAMLRQHGEFLDVVLPSTGHGSLDVLGLDGSRQATLELSSSTTDFAEHRVSLKELGITGRSVVRLRLDGKVVARELVVRPD
jgi:hypothetical protein